MGASGAAGRLHVVYLGGFGRSGSTLLERVLGAIPGWVNIGELVDLPRSVYVHQERCGCGEPFLACPFWGEVGALATASTAGSGGWDPARLARLAELRTQVARQRQLPALLALSRGRGGSSLLAGQVREYQSEYGRIYRAVAEVGGARVVVDASKGPAHGLALGLRLASGRGSGLSTSAWSTWSATHGVSPTPGPGARLDRPQAGHGQRADVVDRVLPLGGPVGRAADRDGPDRPGRRDPVRPAPLRGPGRRPASGDSGAWWPRLGLAVGPPTWRTWTDTTVTLAASHGLSGNPSRFTHGSDRPAQRRRVARACPTRERRVVTGGYHALAAALRVRPGADQPAGSTEKESP